MSVWSDAFTNHPSHGRIGDVDARLQQVKDRDLNAEALAVWDRVIRLVGEAKTRLETADSDLVSTQMLDRLNNALAVVQDMLDAILAQPEDQPANLSDLAAPLDQLATELVHWPPLLPAESAEEARVAVNALRDAVESAMARAQAQVTEAEELTTRLREAVAESETKNQEALAALQEQLGGLTTTIQSDEQRLDAAIEAQRTAFDEAQTQRSTDHAAALEEARASLATTTKELNDAANEASSESLEKANKVLEELKGLEDRASKLVGVIGRTGMAGGYQQDADEEGKAANFWRWFTVALSVVAIAALGWAIAASHGNASTREVVVKVLLSAAFGGVASYTAAQSAHHRRNARTARNREIALKGLGPYLEPLDDDAKKEVLREFAAKLFDQTTDVPKGSKDEFAIGPTTTAAIMSAIEKGLAK